jgi:hypothetical protein
MLQNKMNFFEILKPTCTLEALKIDSRQNSQQLGIRLAQIQKNFGLVCTKALSIAGK